MATYKVIQDIEAEDKLIGPLTLRQCIYAAIACVCGYLSLICLTKGVAFLLTIFIPPMLFTGFFAFPWGRDQPTEIWALAKIRFYIKSRKRVWNQSGAKDLVTITVPKKVEKNYTNGLSHEEVQSRLNALATTLDSRGWALKNTNTNLYDPVQGAEAAASDRLVDPRTTMPVEVSSVDVTAGDDMLDAANNPRAQELDKMMTAASNARRQRLIDQMQQQVPSVPPNDSPQLPAPIASWFLNKPVDMPPVANPVTPPPAAVLTPSTNPLFVSNLPAAEPTAGERALAEELREQREKAQQVSNYQHMKIIQPIDTTPTQPALPVQPATQPPVTRPVDPATIGLARNNDLSVAALARIANKEDESPGEVVISLHNHGS